MISLRRATIGGQCFGPSGSPPVAHMRTSSSSADCTSRRESWKTSSASSRIAVRREQRAELAHLVPPPRQEPVVAEELVLLDVGEDHAREPEQLVEALARLLVEQRAVLLGEPVTLALRAPRSAARSPRRPIRAHVADERRVRDARVVEPAAVVVVEPVAGRHVEPRVLHLLELLEPRLARVALRQLGVDLLVASGPRRTPSPRRCRREAREALELGVRARRAARRSRRPSGRCAGRGCPGGRPCRSRRTSRRSPYPSRRNSLWCCHTSSPQRSSAAVRVEHLDRYAVLRSSLEHDLVRLVLGELRDAKRGELGDQRLHLQLPLRVQLVPVLEVVARALLEELRALGDLGGIGDRVAGDVDVAVDARGSRCPWPAAPRRRGSATSRSPGRGRRCRRRRTRASAAGSASSSRTRSAARPPRAGARRRARSTGTSPPSPRSPAGSRSRTGWGTIRSVSRRPRAKLYGRSPRKARCALRGSSRRGGRVLRELLGRARSVRSPWAST